MSQPAIDLLIDDILMEIFSYLDAKSLKNCCEASPRFNQIIGSNTKFMKKLPLYLNTSSKQNELKLLRRRFHTLSCNEMTVNKSLVSRLIKIKSMKSVRVIEIISCSVQANAFNTLLSGFKNVEKILIAGSTMTDFKKRKLVDLESLRIVVMMESSLEFLDFIGKTKIREFKLHETRLDQKNDDMLAEFLMRTSSLENLAVRVKHSHIYNCLRNDDSKEYTFSLKKLSITFENFGYGDDVDEHFLEILKQHQETLEHLEIESKLTEAMYEFILSQMKLSTLRIDCRSLPNSFLFYNTFLPNIHLQKLIITKGFSTQAAAQCFLRSYRNVRDLRIDHWTDETSNEVLIAAANNYKMLRTLDIPRVPTNPTELPIPSLQSIHIEMVQNAADFQAYASLHTNLRNISVKWVNEDLSHEIMDAVTSHLPRLETLTFGPNFDLTIRLHETLRQNSPLLHTIQLFRFKHEIIPKSPITLPIPNVLHFSNRSSSLVFKQEQDMWHEEDMLYSYSGEDMIISDDDESILSDSDDDDDSMPDIDDIDEDDNFHFNARNIYYNPEIPLIDMMFPEVAPYYYYENDF